jgi:hypothetical protein|tara:strand:+ start:569 stop:832 length:264 start_codon:yes stop_codon:yes gene_type:complete
LCDWEVAYDIVKRGLAFEFKTDNAGKEIHLTMRERNGELNSREELLLLRGALQSLEIELMMAWQSYNATQKEESDKLSWGIFSSDEK